MPYHFPKESLERGRDLYSNLPFNYQPVLWWNKKVVELNFSAKWVPQNVSTLLIGSQFDWVCPFSLFEKDTRFDRNNIKLRVIQNAGHYPWMENLEAVQNAFEEFTQGI